MVATIYLWIVILVISLKIVADFYYSFVSYKEINCDVDYMVEEHVNILILVPVLREQTIISKTLKHFNSMELDNISLEIVIAGTSRELENQELGYVSTGEVVRNWVEENKSQFIGNIDYKYIEVNEKKGDRATQLNYAVKAISEEFNPDVIGVYDADSLPNVKTLLEVASAYNKNPNIIFQQPVHFIFAANNMAAEGTKPILVANAMYQTTWTIIRELSRWSRHNDFSNRHFNKAYPRNDYLIGHGEFIPYSIYKKYEFPEMEVTDGIQLGYRTSMGGEVIKPLHTFCADDVPQEIIQLIHQHKRWFGGCNRLFQAYKWSRKNTGKASICQVIDGYWSQFSWAYAAISIIIAFVLALMRFGIGERYYLLLLITLVCSYCYLITYIAHKVIGINLQVRFTDWLCMPLAIALKGCGPNLYLIERIVSFVKKREITYQKVERK